MTSHDDLNEFVKAVNNQLKRISKNLSITETKKPLKLVYNTIRFSIDALLEEKKKLELFQKSLSENALSRSHIQQNEVRIDNLTLYKELKTLQDVLSQKEHYISSLESELTALKTEILTLKHDFYAEANQQQEKITELLSAQETTKTSMINLETSQTDFFLMTEQSLEKFTEKLNALKTTVEEKLKLKQDKKNLFTEENLGPSFLMSPIRRMESDLRKCNITGEENLLRIITKDLDRQKSLVSNSSSLDNLFEEVIKQIEAYNDEVSERENILLNREEALIEAQLKFNVNLGVYHSITKNLQVIKNEIQTFNSDYLNDKEYLLENMQLLVQSLKETIYDISEKPHNQSNLYLGTNSRKFELNLIKVPDVPEEAIKFVEEKIALIEKKEKELDLVLKENARTTEYLYDAREKIKKQFEDFSVKEQNLSDALQNLEEEKKNMQTKENLLIKLKQDLDKRTIQLNIKEKHIVTKFPELFELENKLKNLSSKDEELNAGLLILEQETKNLQVKENHLIMLKQELDNRTAQLNIKEKQIEAKLAQLIELQNK